MPTSSAISTPSFRERKYSESQVGKNFLQSMKQLRQDGHEMVEGTMEETVSSQPVETVHFGLDGAEFELKLSKAQAEELRRVLEPYIKAGRKIGSMMHGHAASDRIQHSLVLEGQATRREGHE